MGGLFAFGVIEMALFSSFFPLSFVCVCVVVVCWKFLAYTMYSVKGVYCFIL